jgi:hypothetical protein
MKEAESRRILRAPPPDQEDIWLAARELESPPLTPTDGCGELELCSRLTDDPKLRQACPRQGHGRRPRVDIQMRLIVLKEKRQ